MFINKKRAAISVAVFFSMLSFSVFAQYGTGENSIGQFLSENADLKSTENHHVDVAFSRGKAVFLGKADSPKLSYCVTYKGKKVKVKRKSMYPYKQGTVSELSKQLYNCDQPETQILSQLERKDFLYVLYYLDIKYKLDLERK